MGTKVRLLLLLSAILAALTGAGGTRAPAQPVQASATSAPAPAIAAAAVAAETRSCVRQDRCVARQRPGKALVLASVVPLYANRLRE
jgi:hypothetical protein